MSDFFEVKITRKEFLCLPLDTRRRILSDQADQLLKDRLSGLKPNHNKQRVKKQFKWLSEHRHLWRTWRIWPKRSDDANIAYSADPVIAWKSDQRSRFYSALRQAGVYSAKTNFYDMRIEDLFEVMEANDE